MNTAQLDALKKNNEESRRLTREALFEALYLLIKEKEYKQIKVTELCKRAGVSRQAFYRNFSSIDDVLEERVVKIAGEITEGLTADIRQNWIHIFKVMDADRNGIQTLLKADMEHVILKYLNSYLPINDNARKIQAVWNGVIYNLIVDWAVTGKPGDYLEMAELAYQLTKDIPPVGQFVQFHP